MKLFEVASLAALISSSSCSHALAAALYQQRQHGINVL